MSRLYNVNLRLAERQAINVYHVRPDCYYFEDIECLCECCVSIRNTRVSLKLTEISEKAVVDQVLDDIKVRIRSLEETVKKLKGCFSTEE